MRIYLIGFMGTGKSSLGKLVAEKLQVPFMDTDQMIEEEKKKPISEIFSNEGEDAFRKVEAEILRKTQSFDKALIATGGGLPVYYHNMQWLTDHGITMYLQWPEEILLDSLLQHKMSRPLLSDLTDVEAREKAITLLHERIPVYEKSSMTLDMSGDFEKDSRMLEMACMYIW